MHVKNEGWMHRIPVPRVSVEYLFSLVLFADRVRNHVWNHVQDHILISLTSRIILERQLRDYDDKLMRSPRTNVQWTVPPTRITHDRLTDRSRLVSAPHLRLFIALSHPAPRAYPPDASSICTAQSLPE